MRYALVPLLLGLAVAGCDGHVLSDGTIEGAANRGGPSAPAPPGTTVPPAESPEESTPVETEEFAPTVDHPFFPMTPGRVWIYEGDDTGQIRRDEVRAVADARVIDGVSCTALMQEVFLDGTLSELTTEWFAQDADGNIWKFGEESLELNGTLFVTSDDSWVAGENGAERWMMFSAEPQVGEIYNGVDAGGQDVLLVTSMNATAAVPAGIFLNCVELLENPDEPEDQDIILYAPSVGLVSEVHSAGEIHLVSVTDE